MPTLSLPARRLCAGLILGVALLLSLGAALAPPAAADATPERDDAADVVRGYLQARAAAVTAADPAAVLAPWLAEGTRLGRRQVLLARGTARYHAGLGHLLDDVDCDVELRAVRVDPRGTAARVRAHAVVTVSWHAAGGAAETEASGLDHVITLRRGPDGWRVVADRCHDTLSPALLQAAGAGRARVSAAAATLERAARASGSRPLPNDPPATAGDPDQGTPDAILQTGDRATLLPALQATYPEVIYYDRAGAAAYADRYALSYNATYIRFSADCCNFASQSAKAGDMPQVYVDPVWWYDKNGTSSPSDDRWSASWPSCSRQISAWAGRRISWVSSVWSIGRGDFIYYDWTGNGSWDHVAVCVGTNSLGQKIIDAHTTDHYHVYWKLGTSSTKYKFARVFTRW